MANFKRGKPKHQRAGCLCCKPHKAQGNALGAQTHQEKLALEGERLEELVEPTPGSGRRRPNRRKWCKGRPGVLHQPKWEDLRASKGYICFRCQVCGKELDARWGYGWSPNSTRAVEFNRIVREHGWPAVVKRDRWG